MQFVGFTGDDAPRAVLLFLVVWPKMLGIMAGMDQKDSCLEECRKSWVLLGDGFTMYPKTAQCLDFSGTRDASVTDEFGRISTVSYAKWTSDPEVDSRPALGAVTLLLLLCSTLQVFCSHLACGHYFYSPLCLASFCSVSSPEEYKTWILWEIIPEMFPYSALFGSTVDTYLRQCTSLWASVCQQRQVRSANCACSSSWTLVAAQYLVRQWIHVRLQLVASCAVLALRMALVKGGG